MSAGSPHAPRDQPEKERERERARERERKIEEKTRGDQASARPKSFIFQKVLLYLALYIHGNERCKVIQSQQFCPYQNQDFFLQTFTTNDVVYIIFWPWRPVKHFKTLF